MSIQKLFLTIIILLSEPVLGSIVMTSDKPYRLFTESYELVVEYNDDSEIKPFVALTGSCIGHVRIKHDHAHWLNDLTDPSQVNSVKEAVIISPTGEYIELVVEFTSNGFKSLSILNNGNSNFISELENKPYFILGIIKNYAVVKTIVYPLSSEGTKTFLNDCYS